MAREESRALDVLAVWAVSALALAAPIVSYDVWWHLAAGREMVERWEIPRVEAFSHTLGGAPWVDFEWLFQVLAYGVHAAAGAHGLVWCKAALGAAAVAAVYRMAFAQGAGRAMAFLAAACALPLVLTRGFARPEIASLGLFTLFLGAMLRARRRRSSGPLWTLPAWTLLWVNLHGGFVLGLGLLGLGALGAAWEAGDSQKAKTLARPLALCLAACALASLINPYGFGVYEVIVYHLQTVRAAGDLGIIAEWRSLALSERPIFWLLLASSFALLTRDLLKGEGSARFWAPLILAFGVWSSREVRNPPYFALLAGPYLFPRLKALLRTRWTARAAAAGALALAAGSLFPVLKRDFSRPVSWLRFPKGACDFLEAQGIRGKLYNDCAFGGYLEWRFRGERPVFCDSRYLFYPLQQEQALAARGLDFFSRFIARTGATYALLNRAAAPLTEDGAGRPLAVPRSPWPFVFPREQWALVYWDDVARVFLRRDPAYRDLIARLELRYVDPDDIDFILDQVGGKRWSEQDVLEELDRHQRQVGFTFTNHWLREKLRGRAL